MRDFRDKCGILVEKTHNIRLNGRFLKRKRVIFGLNGGLSKRKRVIFGLNGGFLKRKHVIFT
ncbi:Uncharacterised protein [Chlamydia abortus]|nr:Uncharacterised protein [Chlamydia abortus]